MPSNDQLSVTSLSQYVRYNNCERFLRFRLRPDEEEAMRKKWNLTIQPLTPLLKEHGFEFEIGVAQSLESSGEPLVQMDGLDAAETLGRLVSTVNPTLLLQPELQGVIGNYRFKGRADVVRVSRRRDKRIDIHVADIKASRVERAEHRIQVAAYAYLLRQMVEGTGAKIGEVTGSVLHLQDDGTYPVLDLQNTLELDTYFQVLDHLVIAPDSVVERTAAKSFDEVDYHLNYQCDGCLYNALCMYDSAERADLSLVPNLSATEKRMLKQHGVLTVQQLADLMVLPLQGGREMIVARDQQLQVRKIKMSPQLALKLPLLVQRAKRAARRFNPQQESLTYLLGSGWGTLPSDEAYPDLIKIFFDAQHDYLRDRLYMIAALIKGPHGEIAVTKLLDAPPTLESERDLLSEWIKDVLAAILSVTASSSAPMHLYCYNSYDQRTLLAALKRHLDAVSEVPGFFDLMTQHPSLEQPIISFLSSELEERRNLGSVCAPLHAASRQLGFSWEHGGEEYFRIFRARVFDNSRDVIRLPNGKLRPANEDDAKGPTRLTIESASRFNSQIPLEYAYATWSMLPEVKEDSATLKPFRQVTRAQLFGFATHRVRALAHIEASFINKSRFIEKVRLDLNTITKLAAPTGNLARSLQEFLFMEHHAALQEKLATYAIPIEQRVQTGLAMLMRCSRFWKSGKDVFAEFEAACQDLGLDKQLTMNTLRLKEGSWVVLNENHPAQPKTASQIQHGRLAVVKSVEGTTIKLELLSITFKGSRFRYGHHASLEPARDQLYTIDDMADDLNADKYLHSLNNIDSNVLYEWMHTLPSIRARVASLAPDDFIALIHQVERGQKVTAPQRRIIVERANEPLLLVQGPPGTGKSHTIGWAILYRMLNAAAEGKQFRVAVSCKTHNAVNVVLESVAKKLRKIAGIRFKGITQSVQVIKLVNNLDDEVPNGVQKRAANTKSHVDDAFANAWVVIGGTPGGHYTAAKNCKQGGSKVDWDSKRFDLVVIDEASQISQPEGILASAWLKPDGAILVVGDHRQMPPIVAHEWDEEERRSAVLERPHVSLFDALVDRAVARESLDESFRLHKSIARFLQDNIYRHDGIHFHSKRTDLMDLAPSVNRLVDSILNPAYPIVVIEHDESASQQYNETEAIIVDHIMSAVKDMRIDGLDGIGVVVPHRAQKAYLRKGYPLLASVNAIDTVERFQGGERDIIIVSATASDPDFVLSEADFLLDLNRLNVALSRPRKKLIVIASRAVTQLLVSDLKVFENAALWKRLYYQYANTPLWKGRVGSVAVSVKGHPA